MRVVLSLIGRLFKYVKSTIIKTGGAIKNFKESPIDNLAVLIPVGMEVVGLIAFLVTYVLFIRDGGYAVQIQDFKEHGLSLGGTSYKMSEYDLNFMLTNRFFGDAMTLLLIGQILIILIAFFRKESKVIKVLMVIDLGIAGLVVGTWLLVTGALEMVSRLPKEKQAEMAEKVTDVHRANYETLITVLTVTFFVAIGIFIVLTIISKCRWMLGHCGMALLINTILLPILLMLIEYIISLVVGLVFIALMVLFFWIVFMCILEGGKEQGGSTSTGSAKMKSSEKKVSEKPKNCSYEDLGMGECKLYKVHGFTHDYIERDNMVGTREICSLDDFRKGRFHIYDKATGREIKDGEIPWRK